MSEHADVVIVGAGASGGVAALRLARAGLRVVCLEQGDWANRDDYPGAGPDWELLARKQWSSSPNLRAPPGRLPRGPRRLRHGARQLQRRRRGHDPVQRGVAAPAAVRLPYRHRLRDRRRLAAVVRGARPPLRRDRSPVRRVRPRRQPRVPARRGSTPPAAPDRPRRPRARSGTRAPRVALVAGEQRHPLGHARRSPRVRPTGYVRFGVQRGGEGLDRRHALARGTGGRCAVAHRRARAADRGRPRGRRPRRDVARCRRA